MPASEWDLQVWSAGQAGIFRVHIDPGDITGIRGVFGPMLQMPFKVEFPSGNFTQDPLLFTLGGRLMGPGEAQFSAGLIIPQQPFDPNDQILRVPLTDWQVAALEVARGVGPLQLYLVLLGAATIVLKTAQGSVPTARSVRAPSDPGRYLTVQREQWLKIFGDLGGDKIRLLELPELDLPQQQTKWGECMRLLNLASGKQHRGEFEDSIANLRKVVEGIVTVLSEQWKVPRTKDRSFEQWAAELSGRMVHVWKDDPEAANQLARLLATAWTWTSPSHHFGSKIPLKREASFALNLVAALTEFVPEVVRAHPEPLIEREPQAAGQPS